MKQLLQNMKNGKAVIEEVPVPTPRDGFALVKTAAHLCQPERNAWWLNLLRRIW